MRLDGSSSQWNSVPLLCLVLSASWTDAKSFVKTVNTNGTGLCAVDAPSLTFNLESSSVYPIVSIRTDLATAVFRTESDVRGRAISK